MKSATIIVLVLLVAFLADRVVRIENQRYALHVGVCKLDPGNPAPGWRCLDDVQIERHGFGTSTMPRPSACHRCRSGAGSASQVARFGAPRMTDDLVDVFYRPLVQPLGNLVILCAQAEASLLDLVATMQGLDERQAQSVLKREDAKDQVLFLIRDRSGFEGFELSELFGRHRQLLVR